MSRVIRNLLILFLWAALTYIPVCHAGKRGLKQRIAASSSEVEEVQQNAASSSGTRHRGGGIQQRTRMRADDTDASDEPPGTTESYNPLTQNLKRRWGKGELSSATVQDLAHDAAKQGARNLEKLSKVGTYGENPQNLFRDLLKLFGAPVGAPPIEWVLLPTKGGKKCHIRSYGLIVFLNPYQHTARTFGGNVYWDQTERCNNSGKISGTSQAQVFTRIRVAVDRATGHARRRRRFQ